MDNGIIIGQFQSQILEHVAIIWHDLASAGFIVNEAKLQWFPSQRVTWLGFFLDTHNNTFVVPTENIERLKQKIIYCLTHHFACSARDIAKVVGTICSMFLVFGKIVYLTTKFSSAWINTRESWGAKAPIPESVIQELSFWYNNLTSVLCMPLVASPKGKHCVIYLDASDFACGAYIGT